MRLSKYFDLFEQDESRLTSLSVELAQVEKVLVLRSRVF